MVPYPNQKKAGDDIMEVFNSEFYVLLAAQMQSGKTGTFMYVAEQMLFENKVDQVVIFSGNRESLLKKQTIDRLGDLKDVHVVWGPQLCKFVPFNGITLYIWDESHYGQLKGQQVDLFLQKCNLDPKGGPQNGNFLLSVSATPFTEIFPIVRGLSEKKVVFMKNMDGYWSCQNMIDHNKIITYKDPFIKLQNVLQSFTSNKYAIIRAVDRLKGLSSFKIIKQLALANEFKLLIFDMNSSFDLDDILSIQPIEPTLIIIKGTYLMGKSIIHKQFIEFCFETSKFKKTDSLLQSFIGRMSGFNFNINILIYIHYKFFSQILIFNSLFLFHNTSPFISSFFSHHTPYYLSIF
tara:strand:- start:62 stop:1108 length:1047 start_codon:yes stop_codon:yes gene_type:complete